MASPKKLDSASGVEDIPSPPPSQSPRSGIFDIFLFLCLFGWSV
jgi:hypothetical protein